MPYSPAVFARPASASHRQTGLFAHLLALIYRFLLYSLMEQFASLVWSDESLTIRLFSYTCAVLFL